MKIEDTAASRMIYTFLFLLTHALFFYSNLWIYHIFVSRRYFAIFSQPARNPKHFPRPATFQSHTSLPREVARTYAAVTTPRSTQHLQPTASAAPTGGPAVRPQDADPSDSATDTSSGGSAGQEDPVVFPCANLASAHKTERTKEHVAE